MTRFLELMPPPPPANNNTNVCLAYVCLDFGGANIYKAGRIGIGSRLACEISRVSHLAFWGKIKMRKFFVFSRFRYAKKQGSQKLLIRQYTKSFGQTEMPQCKNLAFLKIGTLSRIKEKNFFENFCLVFRENSENGYG